jgi:hypothetical protein
MPPNKSNFSKRPIRRVKLLKIGPKKSVSLFEEYFYGLTAAITLTAMILGKAGGLGGYEAVVMGLWIGAILWFGRMFWKYREGQGIKEQADRTKKALQEQADLAATALASKLKPMIGPQWPVKGKNGGRAPARPVQPVRQGEQLQPGQAMRQGQQEQPPQPSQAAKKPGFVYERPTLPDRPVKLPANWRGQRDKKPKP